MILFSGRQFNKLNGFVIILFDNRFDFIKRNPEKLSSLIYAVYFLICKSIVQRCFKFRSIICKDNCVYIKVKR